ncbi:MAG: hypothetical protein EOO77_43200, partial [Oxalobacteraceae bacterium]
MLDALNELCDMGREENTMSLKSINDKLRSHGYREVELVRGQGYLYFIFDDRGDNYDTESVMVPYLKHHSVTEWVAMGCDYAERKRAEIANKAEELSYNGGPFGAFGCRIEKVSYHVVLDGKRSYGNPQTTRDAAIRLASQTGNDRYDVVRKSGDRQETVYSFDRSCKFAGPTSQPFT